MNNTRGFTLLELSIVLIVIGLLVGGIVTGKSIIRNARLQSVITDVERYTSAVQMFREKYKEFPGDMPNATDMWGTDACPDTANIVPKGITCNGNGNTFIGDSRRTADQTHILYTETIRAWQHLSNGKFINETYNGSTSSRNNNLDPGINIPKSKIQSAGFALRYAMSGSAANVYFSNYGHIFVYGAIGAGVTASPVNPVLYASEAESIDSKMDDGMPGTGKVLSFKPALAATPNCATSADEKTAEYKISSDANSVVKLCSLIFITGF